MPLITSLYEQRAPIVIIGMHRSGTTSVVRALMELGAFFGARREKNEEARLFLALNQWLMDQTGARWDRPGPFDELLERSDIVDLATAYVKDVLDGPRSFGYLGWLALSRERPAWGWKDPRNTFTLPLWLRLFPDLLVVHVTRHGVDVAASLQARSASASALSRTRLATRQRLGSAHTLLPKRGGFVDSLRTADLSGGLELWGEYVRRGIEMSKAVGCNAYKVRFEDLLYDPGPEISALAAFTRLEVSEAQVNRAAETFNVDRAYAYRRVPALAAVADEHADLLVQFGYS